jgi:hypothetical protein
MDWRSACGGTGVMPDDLFFGVNALILNSVGFGPAGRESLWVAGFENRELPTIHFSAAKAPVFAAPVGLKVGLLGVPGNFCFGNAHDRGDVYAQNDVAIGFATPNEHPIHFGVVGAPCGENCGGQVDDTFAHFSISLVSAAIEYIQRMR